MLCLSSGTDLKKSRYVLKSLSLCNKVLSYLSLSPLQFSVTLRFLCIAKLHCAFTGEFLSDHKNKADTIVMILLLSKFAVHVACVKDCTSKEHACTEVGNKRRHYITGREGKNTKWASNGGVDCFFYGVQWRFDDLVFFAGEKYP